MYGIQETDAHTSAWRLKSKSVKYYHVYSEVSSFFWCPQMSDHAQDTIILHEHQVLQWPQASGTGECFRLCISPSGLHHGSPRQEIK